MNPERSDREILNTPESPKEIYLEIGVGMVTMEGTAATGKIHVAFDWNEYNLDTAKDIDKYRAKKFYVVANGENMPLRNDSVETIVMKDVYGEPPNEPGEKELLLEDIKRVLKSDGTLVILEVVTPNVRRVFRNSISFHKQINEELDQLGFDFRKISPTDREWPELMTKYIGERAVGEESFIIVATKPKGEEKEV